MATSPHIWSLLRVFYHHSNPKFHSAHPSGFLSAFLPSQKGCQLLPPCSKYIQSDFIIFRSQMIEIIISASCTFRYFRPNKPNICKNISIVNLTTFLLSSCVHVMTNDVMISPYCLSCNAISVFQGDSNCEASSQADLILNYFLSNFLKIPQISSKILHFLPAWLAGWNN